MNDKLVDEVKKLNDFLKIKYNNLNRLNRENKRELLYKIGEFVKTEKLSEDKLYNIKAEGGVVAIDGSTNKFGGAYPHYIQMFKAVGSTGVSEKNNIEITDIYCPLIDEGSIYEEKAIIDSKLAEVEVKAALEICKKNPKIIMMDGSLIRYRILCGNIWEELKKIALEKNIIIIGIIEDIKTSTIYDNIINKEEDNSSNKIIYDREFIFDSLDYLEALYINKQESGKDSYGFRSAFFRSSKEPLAISVDILEEQVENLNLCLSLVASITDINSRGIPFILDIVDVQTRISNDMTEQLIKSYVDIEFYEKLFNAQRFKRRF